jgi:hypothetical protein
LSADADGASGESSRADTAGSRYHFRSWHGACEPASSRVVRLVRTGTTVALRFMPTPRKSRVDPRVRPAHAVRERLVRDP